MTQRDRDRLVVLKKAQKKLITQKQAAAEMELSERQVRRLLKQLKERGDKAVIHRLRGQPSNRKLSQEVRQKRWKFFPSRTTGTSGRRWRANIWAASIRLESVARHYGS